VICAPFWVAQMYRLRASASSLRRAAANKDSDMSPFRVSVPLSNEPLVQQSMGDRFEYVFQDARSPCLS
jgi:hypothetical protein